MTAPRSALSPVRTTIWAIVTLLAVWVFGPGFLAVLRPPEGLAGDFIQEWASARNYLAGLPVYEPLPDAVARYTGFRPAPGQILEWNAHPPASILLFIPFAGLEYHTAHLAWNLTTLPLYVLTFLLAIRELGGTVRCQTAFPMITLGLICNPLYMQLWFGQFNTVLGSLIVLAWLANRRKWPILAGMAIGLATAVKLFPGLLFLYFLGTRQWRSLASGVLIVVLLNSLALVLFGLATFQVYVRDVLPSLEFFRSYWINVSAPAFWMRLFDPAAISGIEPLVRSPAMAQAFTIGTQVVLALCAVLVAWRSRSQPERDRAFAVACLAMFLASPVAWSHYYLNLIVPIGLLLTRLPRGAGRIVLWASLIVMWLPEVYVVRLLIPVGDPVQNRATAFPPLRADSPLTPAENLLGLSVLTYAPVALFLLTLLLPRTTAAVDPTDSADKISPPAPPS